MWSVLAPKGITIRFFSGKAFSKTWFVLWQPCTQFAVLSPPQMTNFTEKNKCKKKAHAPISTSIISVSVSFLLSQWMNSLLPSRASHYTEFSLLLSIQRLCACNYLLFLSLASLISFLFHQWFSTKSNFASPLPKKHLTMGRNIFGCHC